MNDWINWPRADEFHNWDEENDYRAIFGVIDSVKMDLPMWSHYGEDAQTRLGEHHNTVRIFIKNLVQKKSIEIFMDHYPLSGFRVSRLGRWTTNGSVEDEKTLEKFKNCVFGN
ncbi:hypothetical protein OAQ28_00435 [Planktomarina temperata]|nr:hypothetical protein [Planktomarina temperata]